MPYLAGKYYFKLSRPLYAIIHRWTAVDLVNRVSRSSFPKHWESGGAEIIMYTCKYIYILSLDIYTYYITYNINVTYITYTAKLITSNFLWGNRNVKHFRHVGVVVPFIIWPIMAYLTHEDDGTSINLDVIFIKSHIHP